MAPNENDEVPTGHGVHEDDPMLNPYVPGMQYWHVTLEEAFTIGENLHNSHASHFWLLLLVE